MRLGERRERAWGDIRAATGGAVGGSCGRRGVGFFHRPSCMPWTFQRQTSVNQFVKVGFVRLTTINDL